MTYRVWIFQFNPVDAGYLDVVDESVWPTDAGYPRDYDILHEAVVAACSTLIDFATCNYTAVVAEVVDGSDDWGTPVWVAGPAAHLVRSRLVNGVNALDTTQPYH